MREREKELKELDRDTRTVFAYNLNLKADERDLFDFFSGAGEVGAAPPACSRSPAAPAFSCTAALICRWCPEPWGLGPATGGGCAHHHGPQHAPLQGLCVHRDGLAGAATLSP